MSLVWEVLSAKVPGSTGVTLKKGSQEPAISQTGFRRDIILRPGHWNQPATMSAGSQALCLRSAVYASTISAVWETFVVSAVHLVNLLSVPSRQIVHPVKRESVHVKDTRNLQGLRSVRMTVTAGVPVSVPAIPEILKLLLNVTTISALRAISLS
jgi:hypothetical protein